MTKRQKYMKEYNRLYDIKHKKERKTYMKKYYETHKKIIDKYYKKNKTKIAKRLKNYYELNKKEILIQKINYRKTHKIQIKKQSKKYNQEHKEEIAKQHNLYLKNRRKNCTNYKIIHNLRNRIWSAIRKNSKSGHTLEVLGCSIEFLKEYLESKFTPGMNWSNYGKWHIDHIRPCVSFDMTRAEEQALCFHYTNLQPLWALDNISKGARNDI